MAMTTAYLNAIAAAGASAITHIGLVDETSTEITGGSYARKAVTWTTASGGTIRPNADLIFDIPAGATVAGWRGYDDSSGGTEYGGEALPTQPFTNAGTYTLLAAQTGIEHDAA